MQYALTAKGQECVTVCNAESGSRYFPSDLWTEKTVQNFALN